VERILPSSDGRTEGATAPPGAFSRLHASSSGACTHNATGGVILLLLVSFATFYGTSVPQFFAFTSKLADRRTSAMRQTEQAAHKA
jgi:hypothetical protein